MGNVRRVHKAVELVSCLKLVIKKRQARIIRGDNTEKTNVICNTSQSSIKDEAQVMPPKLITRKNKEQYINVDKMWGGFL